MKLDLKMNTLFVGRTVEVNELKQLQKKENASLVVIQGRRRIGKSRLVDEFAKGQKFYSFAGIEPRKEITAQMQRDEFMRQFGEQTGLSGITMKNWGDIFTLLAKQVEKGRVIVFFDEISWMGSKDPTFLGKLKNAWDKQFSKNPHLMLILCGSVSSWIEKNILNNTAFLGRPHLYLCLEELALKYCQCFWGNAEKNISTHEKFKMLSVTGGVPRYLEMINPKITAEENIRQICFTKNSPLLNEFERIFSDVFGKRSGLYRKIILLLLNGPKSQEEVLLELSRNKGGAISEYLNDLVLAGFVSRDYTWHLHSGNISKLSHYRLKDNYIRFYLKYIHPNKEKIKKGIFQDVSLSELPAWETILGLQFENVVINNQKEILKILRIRPEEVVFLNPYFQRKTLIQDSCQIDLLIQTRFNNVYICEVKFKRKPIEFSVIKEVEQKIQRLKLPKNFSYRTVLIHVNGVSEEVLDSRFFTEVIDFGQMFEME